MKAQFLAASLSLFVVTLPIYAVNSSKIPSEKQAVILINRIDLNKTNLTALIGSFKGIGKKRAEAIIAYRDSHHGFKSIEELAEVKGFGQRFIDANREKLKEVFVIGS